MTDERAKAITHIASLMEEARLNAEHWGVELVAVWGDDPLLTTEAFYACSATEEFLDNISLVVGILQTQIKSKKLNDANL